MPARDIYLIVDDKLRKAVAQLLQTWHDVGLEGEHWGVEVELAVAFTKKSQANKCARSLWELGERNYSPQKPRDFTQLMSEDGLIVFCPIARLIGNWIEIRSVLQKVGEAKDPFITISRLFKKRAKVFLKIFPLNAVDSVTAGSADTRITEEGLDILTRRSETAFRSALKCMRLAVAQCQAGRPRNLMANKPKPNTVVIKSIDGKIKIDGEGLDLNAPKRAALFALAILGTSGIHVKNFALLYNNTLPADEKVPSNYANIFDQAIGRLKENLDKLETDLGEKPHQRHVFGVKIKNSVSLQALKQWLGKRRPQ